MKHKIVNSIPIMGCLILIFVTGCNGVSAGLSSPESVVESYIKALVAKDSVSLSTLSCADWEQSAIMEFDSLQAVEVRLDGLSCGKIGMEGDFTLVNCKGKIIATYNGENQDIDLSSRNYKVSKQDDEFLVCGYQ